MQLIAALAKRGLVHCDFNEFNLMINEAGVVTLIDFPQVCGEVGKGWDWGWGRGCCWGFGEPGGSVIRAKTIHDTATATATATDDDLCDTHGPNVANPHENR